MDCRDKPGNDGAVGHFNPARRKVRAPWPRRERRLEQGDDRHPDPTVTRSRGEPVDLRPLKAPSLDEFEVIAREVYEGLPAHFRAMTEGVVMRIDDYPTQEALNSVGIDDELDLLGLFSGVGLPFQSASTPQPMPNMVWLYRVPILLYWAEHDETLGHIIGHVLIHELGHHFGFSDEDMEGLEREAG